MERYSYELLDDCDEDDKTPICCSVCGGEYKRENCKTGKSGEYRISTCRWCTLGCMSDSQREAWLEWSAKQRAKAANE